MLLSVQELLNAKENNSFENISTSAVTAVKAEAGYLERVIVGGTFTSAFSLYDNASTSETAIATISASIVPGSIEFGHRFDNGLVVSSQSSDTEITVIYR
tara:strand:+ start:696 stop:995 length:300 start_codon:yes stop_codon:yes gene_type:complete